MYITPDRASGMVEVQEMFSLFHLLFSVWHIVRFVGKGKIKHNDREIALARRTP